MTTDKLARHQELALWIHSNRNVVSPGLISRRIEEAIADAVREAALAPPPIDIVNVDSVGTPPLNILAPPPAQGCTCRAVIDNTPGGFGVIDWVVERCSMHSPAADALMRDAVEELRYLLDVYHDEMSSADSEPIRDWLARAAALGVETGKGEW